MPICDISKIDNFFFIGIAGDGMSAIAQYLRGLGKSVSGSDRQFSHDNRSIRQIQLEKEEIHCFPQDASGLNEAVQLVVISTAIEPSVPEYKKALDLLIPVVMRSDVLAAISETKKTIAIGGTSGKSTVTAMIFHILKQNGFDPSLISGAGLIDLQENGKIGNAVTGNGDFLIIEADESDGSITKYNPEIGILLNIDKDHKEISELKELFNRFRENSKKFIVNRNNSETISFSRNYAHDFGNSCEAGYRLSNFSQDSFYISFQINEIEFNLHQIGEHNAENAAAATAAAALVGISVSSSAKALFSYKGIYRRHQIIEYKRNITIIDDYAHNPAKLAASIKACQPLGSRLIIWFQPHGFKPTLFLKKEYIEEISKTLRKNDEFWMSEIYYAGGSVDKCISSSEIIDEISSKGLNAHFVKERNDFPELIIPGLKKNDVILLTGARDPSLSEFAQFVKEKLFDL